MSLEAVDPIYYMCSDAKIYHYELRDNGILLKNYTIKKIECITIFTGRYCIEIIKMIYLIDINWWIIS